MGVYTEVSFILPKDKSLKKLKRSIDWDNWSIKKRAADNGIDQLVLTIVELDLKECLSILDRLKSEFSLRFYVEHGEY